MGGLHKSPISVAEGKAAIKQCQAVRICPVTNGLPTVMSDIGFAAACKRAREQEKLSGAMDARALKFTHCSACKGKSRPAELRVVSLDELRNSREMRQHSPAR